MLHGDSSNSTCALLGFLWLNDVPLELGIPFVLVVGALGGLLNGILVTVAGLPSLVVTLGTLALFRGLALGDPRPPRGQRLPDLVHGVRIRHRPGHSDPVAGRRLHRPCDRPRGRSCMGPGSGGRSSPPARTPSAARFSGVRVGRHEAPPVHVVGLVAALAGVILTARFASARADIGQGLTLTVVTIVLLGGVNIFGGRGTIPGVVLAAMTLAVLGNVLRLTNVSAEIQSIAVGLLLIVSVVLPNVAHQVRSALGRVSGRATHAARRGRRWWGGDHEPQRRIGVINVRASTPAGFALTVGLIVAALRAGPSPSPSAPRRTVASTSAECARVAPAPLGAGARTSSSSRRRSTTPISMRPQKARRRPPRELGGQFTQIGSQNATAAEQIPFIQDATTQDYDAIVVSATGADEVAPALQAAKDAGIKVVGYDSSPAEGAYDVFVNQTDFSLIGGALAQWACDLAPDCTGEIAILSATATATNQNAWIADMETALEDPKFANLKLVETVYGDDDATKSTNEANGLLQKYPDLKVIVAPTTVGILAAAQVVKQAGSAVKVTGLGLPNDMKAFVKDGTTPKFGLWSVPDLGYLAYYVADKLVKGEITTARRAPTTRRSCTSRCGASASRCWSSGPTAASSSDTAGPSRCTSPRTAWAAPGSSTCASTRPTTSWACG